MRIKDKRLRRLVDKFLRKINQIDLIGECLEEVVLVTEKTAARNNENASAYIRRLGTGVNGSPTFKIYLIKEQMHRMSDKEILNALAHEASHIIFKISRDRKKESQLLVERACDVLAEHFFGFPKPRGSATGYIYDEKAFEKVYGRKPYG